LGTQDLANEIPCPPNKFFTAIVAPFAVLPGALTTTVAFLPRNIAIRPSINWTRCHLDALCERCHRIAYCDIVALLRDNF
jgi:hypothetical protein